MLRGLQLSTLEDRSVHEKEQWDSAVRFLESSVKDKISQTESILRDMFGPGFKDRWLYWQYQSPDQVKRVAVNHQFDKILRADYVHILWPGFFMF